MRSRTRALRPRPGRPLEPCLFDAPRSFNTRGHASVIPTALALCAGVHAQFQCLWSCLRLATNAITVWNTIGMTTGSWHSLRSIAGGLGARCAPSGEREGQSPLAYLSQCKQQRTPARSARAEPTASMQQRESKRQRTQQRNPGGSSQYGIIASRQRC